MNKTHLRRELAVSYVAAIDRISVQAVVSNWAAIYREEGVGATVFQTTGYWEGKQEPGLVVRFDWPNVGSWAAGEGRAMWHSLLRDIALALPDQQLGHVTMTKIAFEEVDLDELR